MQVTDEMTRKPRRRVVCILKIEGDSWGDIANQLRDFENDIAGRGRLPASSVSGGYSSGHIVVSSEDGSIDHDKWAVELDAHLKDLVAKEMADASN